MVVPVLLEVSHCKEVLDVEILIGSGVTKSRKTKRFTFNTWQNEYSVWVEKERVDGGQAIEELLEVYNDL